MTAVFVRQCGNGGAAMKAGNHASQKGGGGGAAPPSVSTEADAIAAVRKIEKRLGDDGIFLSSYTGDRFLSLNEAARNNKLTNEDRREIEKVSKALDKLPNWSGSVYRGVTPNRLGDIDGIMGQFKPGSAVSFPGFTSSSTKQSVGRNYAGFNGIGGVTIGIKSKSGKVVFPISRNPQEREVIFKPNSRFRVERVETGLKSGIMSGLVVLTEI